EIGRVAVRRVDVDRGRVERGVLEARERLLPVGELLVHRAVAMRAASLLVRRGAEARALEGDMRGDAATDDPHIRALPEGRDPVPPALVDERRLRPDSPPALD